MVSAKEIIESVRKEILSLGDKLNELEGVGIFGSLIRGRIKKHSDIDIFIIFGDVPQEAEDSWCQKIHDLIYDKFSRDVTVLSYDIQSLKKIINWYVFELASDSIIIYDKGKVKKLFERILEEARKAGLVKKYYRGHPVWMMGRPMEIGELIKVEVADDEF